MAILDAETITRTDERRKGLMSTTEIKVEVLNGTFCKHCKSFSIASKIIFDTETEEPRTVYSCKLLNQCKLPFDLMRQQGQDTEFTKGGTRTISVETLNDALCKDCQKFKVAEETVFINNAFEQQVIYYCANREDCEFLLNRMKEKGLLKGGNTRRSVPAENAEKGAL